MDKLRNHILLKVKDGKRCCLDLRSRKKFTVAEGKRVAKKLEEIRNNKKKRGD